MKALDNISFVSGVDKHGAKPPNHFPHRFAVLTWFEHEGETADPWSLFRTTIPRICTLVHADLVLAEYLQRQKTGILFRRIEETLVAEIAWDGLMHSSDDLLRKQTFPSRLKFMTGEEVVLITETEPWNLVGGPQPYHDSITVSFFTAKPMHEEIHRIFTEETTKLGVVIGEMTMS